MEREINFGIVGYGNIGKRHAGHIMHNEQARLLAVCDIENEAFDEVLNGDISRCNSLDEMLKDDSIKVVNVCTPNYLHKEMTIKSLEAGKHVVCEKPMAISVSECSEMIKAAEQSGSTIFVVKQNRYNPPVIEVKKLLEKGKLGKVFMVGVNCFWNRNSQYYEPSDWRGKRDKDGGSLFTQFSHFVDILYYLFGQVECITGRIKNFGHGDLIEFEDTGIFQLTNKDGALINFHFTTCSYEQNMEGSFTIIGEKGSVKIGGQYLNTIDYQEIENYTIPEIEGSAAPNDYGTYKGSMSNHDKVIQNVIDTLNGKDVVKASAMEGMEVISIIENMYKSCS